jgi:hypothetical protein
MLKVVEKRDEREVGEELLLLDEIARQGARRMLIEALKAEADDYVEHHHGERDAQGHALVVRNGRAAVPAIASSGPLPNQPRCVRSEMSPWC